MTQKPLTQEWTLLQNQFDSYEKYSLLIKLASIIWLAVVVINQAGSCVTILISAIFWLQDAIWKTFQSRIEVRLLIVEEAIAHKREISPCQFNSDFYQNKTSTVNTLVSYLKQALRPTIAYPHMVIIGIMLVLSAY